MIPSFAKSVCRGDGSRRFICDLFSNSGKSGKATSNAEGIMAQMSDFLYDDIGEIFGDAIFIDGTKIEACVNKYTLIN